MRMQHPQAAAAAAATTRKSSSNYKEKQQPHEASAGIIYLVGLGVEHGPSIHDADLRRVERDPDLLEEVDVLAQDLAKRRCEQGPR